MGNALLPTKGLVCKIFDSLSGILIAATMMLLWLSSLIFLFSINLSQISFFWIVPAVLLRTFLHTGLFITAHDAMHGTVFPKEPLVNDFIGSLAARLYVFLPYPTLLKKHRLHHLYPASVKDPDFCKKNQQNPVVWYGEFMKSYLNGKQIWVIIFWMSIIFSALKWGLNISPINLLLFWLMPILFSSIQLFYFGVFLPHRQPEGGYRNRHCAQSSYYSIVWSFLSCYHFGYHWEHHEYPYIPWYRLSLMVER